jgi:hypothetical protein
MKNLWEVWTGRNKQLLLRLHIQKAQKHPPQDATIGFEEL